MRSMNETTHSTAIVIIPPEEVWEPIQAIRQQHDRKIGRWMPHITLIYPFLPKSKFASVARELGPVCRSIPGFEATLGSFDQFGHGKGYYTAVSIADWPTGSAWGSGPLSPRPMMDNGFLAVP